MSFTDHLMNVAPGALAVLLVILAVTMPWIWVAKGRPMLAVERDSRPVELLSAGNR